MRSKTSNYLLSFLFCICFCAHAAYGVENALPIVHADFTDATAHTLALKLKQEEESTEYKIAFSLMEQKRFVEAIEKLTPLAQAGNSMAMHYIGKCMEEVVITPKISSNFE